MEQTKTESQKLGEQILESLRKYGVKIPGNPEIANHRILNKCSKKLLIVNDKQ